jgi:hypothetical protein
MRAMSVGSRGQFSSHEAAYHIRTYPTVSLQAVDSRLPKEFRHFLTDVS